MLDLLLSHDERIVLINAIASSDKIEVGAIFVQAATPPGIYTVRDDKETIEYTIHLPSHCCHALDQKAYNVVLDLATEDSYD